jgi:outer membrane protein TolC
VAVKPAAYIQVDVGNIVALPGRMRAARATVDVAEAERAVTLLTVEAQVRSLVATMGQEEAVLRIRRQDAEAARAAAFLGETQFRDGTLPLSALTDLRTRAATAEVSALEAEGCLTQARIQLEATVGMPLDEAWARWESR